MSNKSGTPRIEAGWLKVLRTRFRERFDEAVERVDHSLGWDKLPVIAQPGTKKEIAGERAFLMASRADIP